jgi:hypothetical protein
LRCPALQFLELAAAITESGEQAERSLGFGSGFEAALRSRRV